MAIAPKGKSKSDLLKGVGEYDSPRIDSDKATVTNETLIGCMKNANVNDGFFIVNATDPAKNISDSVTVTFNNATSAICYIKGKETKINLTNGSYTFDLELGEGVFVIPVQ